MTNEDLYEALKEIGVVCDRGNEPVFYGLTVVELIKFAKIIEAKTLAKVILESPMSLAKVEAKSHA